ncbi:hypothetical protein ACLOJK_019747 [Asimina triloba]
MCPACTQEFGTPPERQNMVLHLLHVAAMAPTAGDCHIERSDPIKSMGMTGGLHPHQRRLHQPRADAHQAAALAIKQDQLPASLLRAALSGAAHSDLPSDRPWR